MWRRVDVRLHLFIIFMFDNIIRLFLCLLYLHFPIKWVSFVEDDWEKQSYEISVAKRSCLINGCKKVLVSRAKR